MNWPANEIQNGSDFAPRVPQAYVEVEVRQKSDQQNGVYARQVIRKGTVVFRDGGVVVPMTTTFPKYGYSVVIAEGLMLAPRDYDNMESIYFLNHSCDANLARLGGLIFTAKRDILSGEELTVDYSPLLADYKDDWSLECHCGARECRRRITSKDWQNRELAVRLWTEWLPFIQKKVVQ